MNMGHDVKAVTLIDRQGGTIPAEFRLWEEEPGLGEVRLDLVFGGRTLSAASADGYFHAMVKMRRALEPEGLRPRASGHVRTSSPRRWPARWAVANWHTS
jgi:hypothetical protein